MKINSLNTALEKYRELNLFIRLAINGIVLYLIWTVFYKIFRDYYLVDYFYEEVTHHLTNIELIITKVFLGILGYDVEIFGKVIKIIGGTSIHLDRGCLGRNPIGLFVGFILAFPGIISRKLWYISLGLLVISFLNICRIVALFITNDCCSEYMDLNHHYIFKIIVYIFIFIMWFIWISKVNRFTSQKKFSEKTNVDTTDENNVK